jgi:hypothetical protein
MTVWRAVVAIAVTMTSACGGPPTPSSAVTPVVTAESPSAVPRNAGTAGLIPIGFGTLKQDDISIVLEANGVRIAAIPLDESVIRTLAPDSYRGLHTYVEGDFRRRTLQRASMHGIRDPRVWFVRFDGLAPDVTFVPTDVTVTSGGRDYRPVDVVPISTGFGEQRLQPRETQRGLLIFDESVDPSQPLVVSAGGARNADWDLTAGGILRRLDTERSAIRGRAAGSAQPPSRPR